MTFSTDIPFLQDGWTPLFFAVKQGHVETLQLLLEHGAAVNIESNVCCMMWVLIIRSS
jgi:ankyrin repeat protein